MFEWMEFVVQTVEAETVVNVNQSLETGSFSDRPTFSNIIVACDFFHGNNYKENPKFLKNHFLWGVQIIV